MFASSLLMAAASNTGTSPSSSSSSSSCFLLSGGLGSAGLGWGEGGYIVVYAFLREDEMGFVGSPIKTPHWPMFNQG